MSGIDLGRYGRAAEALVLVVSDGAGGWGDGGRAADMIVEGIRSAASGPEPSWAVVLRGLDAELARANVGEATAVVVAVTESGLRGASVGDSAAFVVAEGVLEEISRHQRRKPLLGAGNAHVVEFELARWNGRVLLVSDGIVKYVPRGEIPGLVDRGRLDEAVAALAERALLPGGGLQDDLAIVLCEKAAE